MSYKVNEEKPVTVIDGYNILLKNIEANLGWRVIINFYLKDKDIKVIVEQSEKGKNIIDILENYFVTAQKKAIKIISLIKKGEKVTDELKAELKQISTNFYDEIIMYYTPVEKLEDEKPDTSKPSILLSSFVGCKGLSAGHVIIIGANDEAIPKDNKNITDVEISQFMVALTRTRKQCHIVSNQWHIAPFLAGAFQTKYKKTCFLDWIPVEFIEDRGILSAKEFK